MEPTRSNDPYRELKEHRFIKVFKNLFEVSFLLFHFLFALIFIAVPTYAFTEIFGESFLSVLSGKPMPEGKTIGDFLFAAVFLFPFLAAGIFMLVLAIRDFVKFTNPPSLAELHLKKQKFERERKIRSAYNPSRKSTKRAPEPKRFLMGFQRNIKDDSSAEYTSSNYFLTGAIAIGFFAILWNGIISTAFFDINLSHFLGFILLFFMIPFILVGVVLIGLTLYCIAMCFLPVFRFSIKPGEPSLGQAVKFDWSFDKPPRIIKFISIWIEATHIETETHDTDDVVTRSSLYRKFLVERGDPLSYGKNISFTFPDDLSVPETNNLSEIVWSLRVRGTCLGKIGYNLVLPIIVRDKE